MLSSITRIMPSKRVLITLGCTMILPLAFIYTSYAIQNKPKAQQKQQQALPPAVQVVTVKPASYRATINSHGEVRPKYELTLTAEVAGRVTHIQPELQNGQQLNKQHLLAAIDPTSYKQQLAAAMQTLAEAKLAFLQEQQEAKRAKDEWQQAGLTDTKPPALLLRLPQLEAASARLEQAKTLVAKAQMDLTHTQIRAPFASVVVERLISPGQYLQPGDPIATLYSTDNAEIRITLTAEQWQLLPMEQQRLNHTKVLLTDARGAQWQAQISQIDQHINRSDRQRSLTISLEQPLQKDQPLLAGNFLNVSLQGAMQQELLAIPVSSLTSQGQIWYVDKYSQLNHFQAQILFQQKGRLFIKAPSAHNSQIHQGTFSILTLPLPSYISGQKVIADAVQKANS